MSKIDNVKVIQFQQNGIDVAIVPLMWYDMNQNKTSSLNEDNMREWTVSFNKKYKLLYMKETKKGIAVYEAGYIDPDHDFAEECGEKLCVLSSFEEAKEKVVDIMADMLNEYYDFGTLNKYTESVYWFDPAMADTIGSFCMCPERTFAETEDALHFEKTGTHIIRSQRELNVFQKELDEYNEYINS